MARLATFASALVVLLASTAHAAGVIHGANNPAVDVAALQAAFDAGGRVRLSGTFDLGTSTIYITRDAVITAAPGGATIRNGGDVDALYGDPRYGAFYVGWNGQILDAPPASGEYGALAHPDEPGTVRYFPASRPAVTIRGLHFENAARGAIFVGASRSLTIEENVITGVRNGAWNEWYIARSSFRPQTRALGIAISGGFWPPYLGVTNPDLADADALASMAASVSGPVIVRDNLIRDVGTSGSIIELDVIEPIGVVTAATAADLRISGNDIASFPMGGLGILVITNLTRTRINDNTVEAPWAGIVGWSFMFSTRFDVRDNTVLASPFGVGIALEGDTYVFDIAIDGVGRIVDSRISGNHIVSDGAFAAIDIETNHEGTIVSDNVLEGTGTYGINTFDWGIPGVRVEGGRISDNDATAFFAEVAQINLTPIARAVRISDNQLGGAGVAVVLTQANDGRISDNDYRAAGVPGFEEGAGCVLLDAGTSGNRVDESLFPAGTDADEQILDLGDNL